MFQSIYVVQCVSNIFLFGACFDDACMQDLAAPMGRDDLIDLAFDEDVPPEGASGASGSMDAPDWPAGAAKQPAGVFQARSVCQMLTCMWIACKCVGFCKWLQLHGCVQACGCN